MSSLKLAFLGALIIIGLAAAPAFATNWVRYDPEHFLWLDTDTIVTRGDFTYFTWSTGSRDGSPPTTQRGFQTAVNCTNGDSLSFETGAWKVGPHYGDSVKLRIAVCERVPKLQGAASWSKTVTLNFDSVTQIGCVDATSYLGRFGVTVTGQSTGTMVSAGGVDKCFHGDVVVPSPPKALYVANNQPVSFTLNFDRPLSRVTFVRARLNAGSSGVNTVGWSATAYSATGAKLTQVGEGAGSAYRPNFIAAVPFTLSGTGIRSVAFVRTSPSGPNTSFGVSFPVLDDFVLTE